MAYDPLAAKDPEQRRFKNVLKCVVNEIITLKEAHERGRMRDFPEGADPAQPFWDLHYEAQDARLMPDGIPLPINAGSRLFTKEAKRQDNTQRPFLFAKMFNKLGISIFPGDPDGKFDSFCASIGQEAIGANPNYLESQVVGRIFVCEMTPAEDVGTIGRNLPMPLTAESESFKYTGEVRPVNRKDSEDSGTAASIEATAVDLAEDADALAKVKAVLEDVDVTNGDAVFDALRKAGIDNKLVLDGESVLGIAMNGELPAKLEALAG